MLLEVYKLVQCIRLASFTYLNVDPSEHAVTTDSIQRVYRSDGSVNKGNS